MDIKVEHTSDFKEISRLNETVQNWHHENYPDEFKPFDPSSMEAAFEQMFQKENIIGLIARKESESIGYLIGFVKTRPVSAFQYEKTVLYIDQIAVIREHRGRGVGQLLLDEAERLAKEKQINELQLDFWSGNQQAVQFFQRNGFEYFNHKMKK